MKSEWGKNTLYLWENQEKFAPLLDAWEIANRNNIFNDIGLKRLPFIANSDFHKPKHIYSWKTLIHCEKDAEAIKDCIRRNEHVAITLYRDFAGAVPKPRAAWFRFTRCRCSLFSGPAALARRQFVKRPCRLYLLEIPNQRIRLTENIGLQVTLYRSTCFWD